MKSMLAAMLLALSPLVATAGEDPVLFRVSVKEDGRVIASPSFFAEVGRPATIRLENGLAIEALPTPFEPDGHGWTQVRITFFETPDTTMVQEMRMRHKYALRTGSFEFTDPTNRRFVVRIGK